MSTLTILFYILAVLLVAVFISSAFVSLLATKRRNGYLERRAGDVAFLSFLSTPPVLLGAVTQDVRIFLLTVLLSAAVAIVGFISRPRCPRCGQGLNLLTNRQFRQPRCVFCGAPET